MCLLLIQFKYINTIYNNEWFYIQMDIYSKFYKFLFSIIICWIVGIYFFFTNWL